MLTLLDQQSDLGSGILNPVEFDGNRRSQRQAVDLVLRRRPIGVFLRHGTPCLTTASMRLVSEDGRGASYMSDLQNRDPSTIG